MVLKNLFYLLLILVGIDVLNGYHWYCAELIAINNSLNCFLSICTIIFSLNTTVAFIGLIRYSNYTRKHILSLMSILLILEICYIFIIQDSNEELHFYTIVIAYFGKFLSLLLIFYYYKKIKENKYIFYIIIFLWIIFNFVYPMIY